MLAGLWTAVGLASFCFSDILTQEGVNRRADEPVSVAGEVFGDWLIWFLATMLLGVVCFTSVLGLGLVFLVRHLRKRSEE